MNIGGRAVAGKMELEGINAMTFKGGFENGAVTEPGKQLDLSVDRTLTIFSIPFWCKKQDCLKMSLGKHSRLPGQLILWEQRLPLLPAEVAAPKFSFQWDLVGGFLSQVGGSASEPQFLWSPGFTGARELAFLGNSCKHQNSLIYQSQTAWHPCSSSHPMHAVKYNL